MEEYSRREVRYRWKTLTLNDGKKRSSEVKTEGRRARTEIYRLALWFHIRQAVIIRGS